jgi:hypothetical protein
MSESRLPIGRFAWFLVCGLIACATAGATYALADRPGRAIEPARVKAGAAPTAAEFAIDFVGLANRHAALHNDPRRISNADCVEASTGHYMCSYAVTRPAAAKECHLIQARWTPARLQSFTITLSGRTTRCGSLREAIRTA